MAILVLASAAGCNWQGLFRCTDDSACDLVAGGRCEVTGECSYADAACDSGRRYSDRASAQLRNTCVAPDCNEDLDCQTVQNGASARCCNHVCVDSSSDRANCGVCGVGCMGANEVCCAGVCQNDDADVNNCGGCGIVCSSVHVAPMCSAGTCAGTCETGFANCTGNRQADGCETDLMTSLVSCGVCGNACTNAHGATECASGACAPTCDVGYESCDGSASNGCETAIFGSDANHCGACGHACGGANVATPGCAIGVCAPTCQTDFGDCDGNGENGCEGTLCGSTGNTCAQSACVVELDLKLYLAGFWTGSAMIDSLSSSSVVGATASLETDFLVVELHEFTDPSKVLVSKEACVYTDGTVLASCGLATVPIVNNSSPGPLTFDGVAYGTPYWLVIKHRNHIETWSHDPIVFSSPTLSYDFTTAANKAYADNQQEVASGVWAFHPGDVDQSGDSDLADYAIVESAVFVTLTGYQPTDLTGDAIVESMDYAAIENAVYEFVSVEHPPYPPVAPLTLAPSANAPALGGSLSLTVAPMQNLGGSPPYEFSWVGPNGFTSTARDPSISNVTAAAAGTYTVTVTDQAGRTAIGTVHASVYKCSPQAGGPCVSLSSNAPVCAGSVAFKVTLLANAKDGNGTFNYQWTGPGGFALDAGPTSVPVNVQMPTAIAGTYNLTVSDTANPPRSVTTSTDVVTVNDCDHVTMSITNCAQSASNKVAFDITVKSDGSPGSDLKAAGFQLGVNIGNAQNALLSGNVIGLNVAASTTITPPLAGSTVFRVTGSHVRVVHSPDTFTRPPLVLDSTYVVQRIELMGNWVPGATTSLALQSSLEDGKIRSLFATYRGNDPNLTNFALSGSGNNQLTIVNNCTIQIQ